MTRPSLNIETATVEDVNAWVGARIAYVMAGAFSPAMKQSLCEQAVAAGSRLRVASVERDREMNVRAAALMFHADDHNAAWADGDVCKRKVVVWTSPDGVRRIRKVRDFEHVVRDGECLYCHAAA